MSDSGGRRRRAGPQPLASWAPKSASLAAVIASPAEGFGILASSSTPVKLIPTIGSVLSGLSFLSLLAIIVRAVFFGVPFPGWGTIVSLLLLLFGFLFLMLGMVAEYVDMIFREVQARPPYLLRGLTGFGNENDENPGTAGIQ